MTARGIHTLDAMIRICGRVSSVFATSQRRVLDIELDDTTAALLKFESGVSAYLGTLIATGEYCACTCSDRGGGRKCAGRAA